MSDPNNISFDVNSINNLFDEAANQGVVSQEAKQIIVSNINGNVMAGAGGAGASSLATDDVVLLSLLLDMSGSMSSLRSAVISEVNKMFKALRASKAASSILVSLWVFNGNVKLVYNWTKLENVANLTSKDYDPDGTTALFDSVIQSLSGMSAYAHTLSRSGIRTRGVSVVLSDGADMSSQNSKSAVKVVADSMIAQENNTLAFGGFGDKTAMEGLAREMGYPAVWVSGTANEKELRALFELVSGSVIQGSMGTGTNFNNQFFNAPTTPTTTSVTP